MRPCSQRLLRLGYEGCMRISAAASLGYGRFSKGRQGPYFITRLE